MTEPMTEPTRGWTTRLHVRMRHSQRQKSPRISLSVRSNDQRPIVRAHFTGYPDHPRALLSMLEGLALWRGSVLDVAISADAPVSSSLGLGAFGGERWPTDSALVRFEWVSEEDQARAETGIDHWWPPALWGEASGGGGGRSGGGGRDGGRGKG